MGTPCACRWEDSCIAAAVLAVDPNGVAGISVRSAAGPVRDAWLDFCTQVFPRQTRWQRIPLNVGDDRLLGGLDLAATLQAGRPVAEQGLLARADGGVIVLPMAERLSAGAAAKIGCAMDRREVVLERDGFGRRASARFAVIALDEGIEPDERPPDSLLERLALHVDLNGLPLSATVAAAYCGRDISRARNKLAQVRVAEEIFGALCEVSSAFGVSSARAAWFALRVARALAALEGRDEVAEKDVSLAARLVFATRAIVAPAAKDSQSPPSEATQPQEATRPQELVQPREAAQDGPEAPSEQQTARSPREPAVDESQGNSDEPGSPTEQGAQAPGVRHCSPLGERVVEATKASLPVNFLSQHQPLHAQSNGAHQAGRTGPVHRSNARGRPSGTAAAELRPGARVNIVETLRAAAPWQRIRRLASERAAASNCTTAERTARSARAGSSSPRPEPLVRVNKDDIRIIRFIRRSRSTTIFVVDASGSAALHRLAEVKGAVELMLAESYVRRDRVALISFRGAAAQLLLPPTNSLLRAKRELASLPGGGGTPLAIGLDTARVLADSLKRRGESPIVVVLTDGRPNVARDGKGNRIRAEADAVSAARMMRTNSIASLMVDTAPQPRASTEHFAREMGARYILLPHADAGTLASAVSQCGRAAHVPLA